MQDPTDDFADASSLVPRAAQALAWFLGGLGVLLCIASAVQLALDRPPGASVARGLFGGALVVSGWVASRLLARGRPQAAVTLVLTVAALGAGLATAGVGVGTSGVAIPGITLLIVMAGLLASDRGPMPSRCSTCCSSADWPGPSTPAACPAHRPWPHWAWPTASPTSCCWVWAPGWQRCWRAAS